MPAVRAAESAGSGRVHDFRAARHSSDGHASAQRLGHGNQIGFDAEMLGSKPFAGARESGLHFVRNEKDAVLAANILEKLEVIARRNDEAAFSENRLGDYGGDGFGCNGAFERVFEMMCKVGGRCAGWTAIWICKRNAVDVARKRLETSFVRMRLAGERHSEKRASVKGIFEANDSGPFCIRAGDLNGVFDSLGPGIEKNRFLSKTARSERIQFFGDSNIAFIWSDGEAEVQILFELLADRRGDAWGAVADIEATYSSGEIDVTVAVDIFNARAIGTRGEYGRGAGGPARERGLRAPPRRGPSPSQAPRSHSTANPCLSLLSAH